MQSFWNTKKSVSRKIAKSFVVLALTITVTQGTNAIAGTDAKNAEHQLAQSNSEYDAKVNVSREKMTSDKKSKLPTNDSRIGAFSMADEAREGYYGDGEFAE